MGSARLAVERKGKGGGKQVSKINIVQDNKEVLEKGTAHKEGAAFIMLNT
jgi:hypothetical protein